ncbi:MAG: TrkA family potassium uptake protein [Candidatus Omnitrophota bacterium]
MRQFAVIGLGRFGSSVATTLSEKGCQVLAIDIDDAIVQDYSEITTHAVCVDATDAKALKAVGIETIDVAVVSVGDIEASILITLILKEIGVKEVISKSRSQQQAKVLERIGVNRVVFPERDMGVRLANMLTSPKVSEHIDLSDECSIVEIQPPNEFVGQSLKKLNLRVEFGLNIVAIKNVNKDGDVTLNTIPEADYEIKASDKLMVVGPNKNLDKLKQKD